MTDNKLDELIEKYVAKCFRYDNETKIAIEAKDKAKQAILDYVIKLRNEWFNKGLKAGKISNNKSGCCCVFEDDGETITNMCGAHNHQLQDTTKAIKEVWEKYGDASYVKNNRNYISPIHLAEILLQVIEATGLKAGWIKK